MRTLLLACIALTSGCAVDDAVDPEHDLVAEGAVGKADGQCPIIPAHIAPTAPPQYSCNAPPALTQQLFADVNQFWGSQIRVCECGPDFADPSCRGGFSTFHYGYVWVGTEFANQLLAQTGSTNPLQHMLAHEVGHEIQGHYDYAPTVIQRELGADCLAGYYVASLSCRGLATQEEVAGILNLACQIGEPDARPDGHGTCDQRRDATARGIQGYFRGEPPLVACRY